MASPPFGGSPPIPAYLVVPSHYTITVGQEIIFRIEKDFVPFQRTM